MSDRIRSGNCKTKSQDQPEEPADQREEPAQQTQKERYEEMKRQNEGLIDGGWKRDQDRMSVVQLFEFLWNGLVEFQSNPEVYQQRPQSGFCQIRDALRITEGVFIASNMQEQGWGYVKDGTMSELEAIDVAFGFFMYDLDLNHSRPPVRWPDP